MKIPLSFILGIAFGISMQLFFIYRLGLPMKSFGFWALSMQLSGSMAIILGGYYDFQKNRKITPKNH